MSPESVIDSCVGSSSCEKDVMLGIKLITEKKIYIYIYIYCQKRKSKAYNPNKLRKWMKHSPNY